MKIVIDTNIIYADHYLTGAKISNLCSSVRSTGDEVYIPQVVVDEAINQYKEGLTKKIHDLNKSLAETERFLDRKLSINIPNNEFVSTEVDKYKKSFMAQIKMLGVKIIPYPKTSHEILVKKDLNRKKPFTIEGKGYRDALIWECIKELILLTQELLFHGPQVVFICKNTKDFCSNGLLHSDLIEDLSICGISDGMLELSTDIDDFIVKHIKPKQKILDDILSDLKNTGIYNKINISNEIDHRVNNYLSYKSFEWEDSPFPPEYENPMISSVEVKSCEILDVRQISDEEIVIEIKAITNCEFDVFLFKSDVMCMDQEELPYIWNNDWNKHYMAASAYKELNIDISFIVDSGFSEILSESFDMESFNQ